MLSNAERFRNIFWSVFKQLDEILLRFRSILNWIDLWIVLINNVIRFGIFIHSELSGFCDLTIEGVSLLRKQIFDVIEKLFILVRIKGARFHLLFLECSFHLILYFNFLRFHGILISELVII